MIDIDYFKLYNDCYGHQKGDECLTQIAQAIEKVTKRSTDLVARYGGEEFVAILPDTDISGALKIADSMKEAIAILALPHAKSQVSNYVTLSLGLATIIPDGNITPENLIAYADEALYNAKKQGRNRVTAYGQSIT